jgi:spore germination protein KC
VKLWRLWRVIVCFFPLVALSGCWDRQEIEERTSVLAIGLDKVENHQGMLRMSVQVPIPKKISGSTPGQGGAGGKEAVKVMSSTGFTVAEASRNLQKRLNQELFYGHTRVVAISEGLAREGVDKIVDALRRTPQMRRLLWPIVVKGEALPLLKSNPKLEQIPIVFVMDLLNNNAKMGSLPSDTLGEFYINLSDSTREPDMNIMEATPDEVKWVGLAIFQGGKMVGQLTPREVTTLLHIRDKKKGGTLNINCPEGGENKGIAYRPKTIKTKKTYEKMGGKMAAHIQVRLEGDILESQCQLDLSQPKNSMKVQQAFNRELEKRADKLIQHVQKDLGQDVFGFGTDVRAHHPEWWDSEKWKSDFSKMEIDVHYDVLIRRMGMELK